MKARLRATCVECSEPFFPLRRGLCERCYRRGRRKARPTDRTSILGPAVFWLREAERWDAEGFPNCAATYREIAALADARAEVAS